MMLHVAGLWRYPVKSLAGEAIETAFLGADGIPGDPWSTFAAPRVSVHLVASIECSGCAERSDPITVRS